MLLLLLEWEIVKVTADGELAVYALLGDVEVLDIEETLLANGGDEGASELLPAFWSGVEGEVDGDQVGPVKVSLCRGLRTGSGEDEREWLTFVSWTYW